MNRQLLNRQLLKPIGIGIGIVGLVMLAGCSSKSDGGDESLGTPEATALDLPNGGYDSTDSTPYFSDPTVKELPTFDATYADATDMTTDAIAAPGATVYHIALLWGHLPPASDATTTDVAPQPIDWSGSVSVDAGAIGLKKTLLFDARDHVTPRTDAKTLSFDSHTLPYVDGLYLSVVIPSGGTPTLHFATAALTTDIDLGQFATKEGDVDRLADGRNGLAYIGFMDTPNCAKGLLFGRWVKYQAAAGTLRGVVVDGNGDMIGDVRGIWGHAAQRDQNVFFGKYISLTGGNRGLFGGQYAAGHYAGSWGTIDPANVGHLEGVYSDGYDNADGRGVFVGRWSEQCK
jgi:hypothetical protein